VTKRVFASPALDRRKQFSFRRRGRHRHRQSRAQGRRSTAVLDESIAEFRVNSALYTAENGEVIGAQIDIVTKVRQQRIHGSAFEFLRNDKFDARSTLIRLRFHSRRSAESFGGSVGVRSKRTKPFSSPTRGLTAKSRPNIDWFVPAPPSRASISAVAESCPILILPRGTTLPGTRASINGRRGSQNWREDSGMARFDYRSAMSLLFTPVTAWTTR